jgi:hypothetical protein
VPSPIAAIDLITNAMRKMGVLAVGEVPSANEATVGLTALNDVIETWNLERLSLVGSLPASVVTVAGQNTYSIGPGGNWNVDRPVMLSGVYCTVNGVDFPVGSWTLGEYLSEPVKSQQQQIIERFVYINDEPLGQVILWPTPMTVIPITLNYDQSITSVPTIATTLTLAPGYARALTYAVGVELQAEYGGQDLSAYARSTKAAIKRANRQPQISGFDSALTGNGKLINAGWVA